MAKILEPQGRMVLYPMSVEEMTELGTRMEEAHKAGLDVHIWWPKDKPVGVRLSRNDTIAWESSEESPLRAFRRAWAMYCGASLYE